MLEKDAELLRLKVGRKFKSMNPILIPLKTLYKLKLKKIKMFKSSNYVSSVVVFWWKLRTHPQERLKTTHSMLSSKLQSNNFVSTEYNSDICTYKLWYSSFRQVTAM